MKLIVRVAIACLLMTGMATYAETKNTSAETNSKTADINVQLILDNYIKTWAMVDSVTRLQALEKIWVKKGIHESPFSHSQGIEAINAEIDGFLKMFPNAIVRLSDIKRTNNKVVCKFVLQNAQGEELMSGVDYFELNDAGKIIKVIGFVEERQATQ